MTAARPPGSARATLATLRSGAKLALANKESLVAGGDFVMAQAQPGQKYGNRVHGLYNPDEGQRFNPNKLLLDPYAKAIHRQIDWDPALFSYNMGDPDSRNDEDSAPHMMLGVVIGVVAQDQIDVLAPLTAVEQ